MPSPVDKPGILTTTPSASAAATPAQLPAAPAAWFVQRPLFWLAAGIIAVLGVLVALTLTLLRMQAIESGQRLTEAFVQIIEEQTTRTIQTIDQRLQLAAIGMAQLDSAGGLNEQSARVMLREQVKELPFVRAIWVMDEQGRI